MSRALNWNGGSPFLETRGLFLPSKTTSVEGSDLQELATCEDAGNLSTVTRENRL